MGLQSQIDESNRLNDWVGMDLSNVSNNIFFLTLREKIDPYEYRSKVWQWKLRRIRLWVRLENRILSTPRKIVFRSWHNIVGAHRLEEKGFSKAEIARTLKISPSAISNWLSRYGATSISDIVKNEIKKRTRVY